MEQWLQQEDNQMGINMDNDEDRRRRRTSTLEEANSDFLREIRKEMDEQRNEEGNGRAEKHYQGKDGSKFGQNCQKDGFTFYRSSPGVPGTLQVPTTPARAL